MLYGVELNEPYQIGNEQKYRCWLQSSDEGAFSWTNKPERAFCTEDQDSAQKIANTLAESWDARVAPVEEGTERSGEELDGIVAAFRERERERRTQFRQIR